MTTRVKTAEVKLLEGSPNHSGMNLGPRKDEPVGECPKSESKEVKAIWKECSLDWELLLTIQDRAAFLMYCRTQSLYDETYKELSEDGTVDFNTAGRMITSARFSQLGELTNHLLRLYSTFGATPTARNRVPGKHITSAQARKGGLDLLTGGKDE